MRRTHWLGLLAVAMGCLGNAHGLELAPRPVSPEEVIDWAAQAFAKEPPAAVPDKIEIRVLRQDHSVLQFGRSCIDTPLTIGTTSFTHGLGTHANSEIQVSLPPNATGFSTQVGVDSNPDTGGTRGSVVFIIAIDDKEYVRTPVIKGGDEAVPFSVDIPQGAKILTLKVTDADDGPACDQADWADAQIKTGDGRALWLDEHQNSLLFLNTTVPFSFLYDGAPSETFIDTWKQDVTRREEDAAVHYQIRWTDPKTNLVVGAELTAYKQYAAADWVISFENKGTKDTPIIENIQAMDALLRTGYAGNPALINGLEGDACAEASFRPKTTPLETGKSFSIAPTGGRSSSISGFPFFDVQYTDQGLLTAIGWTGQWAAHFDRRETGPTRLQAGMEKTHLRLHPGESIRTPRILVMPWAGDRIAAHNQFRRLLVDHYIPKEAGKPVPLPIALQTFDRYNSRPEWACESGQLAAAAMAKKLGCDTYWLDAAWFPGNFPNGVGNWFCKPAEFPNGLKPISDFCHQNNMRFVVWFEPERVAAGSQIAREHPEFVFGGDKGGLFKLNDPDARRWLTELLSQRISEYGIDVYRNDFNMDPLDSWRNNDEEDRQGITEIRYVEGLYAMWDELSARHPGLIIDNCSSGGRRIDIEMCSRSVPLWRSDTNCFPNHPEWNQAQSLALCEYIPLHTAAPWIPEPYTVRSSATAGLLCQFAYLDKSFDIATAQRLIAEARENQAYWLGDFYPLSTATTDLISISAWQLHRADLDAGIVLAFRRPECNYRGIIVGLSGLHPEATYNVQYIDDSGKITESTRTGAELRENLELRLPEKKSSLIVRYKKAS